MPYVGSFPQSGCMFIEPTQFAMIVLEFASTGAAEMSVFQRLLLVNGTNPLRLAPWPVAITLQERFPPPVPPLFPPPPPEPPLPPEPPVPPEFPEDCEIPEQAVKQTASANRVASSRGGCQPVP